MPLKRAAAAAALLVALLAAAPAAQAGRACDAKPLAAVDVARAMDLALATARALDASGATVAVLARAGQDLGRYGLRWSHLGFAYRVAEPLDGRPGTWRVAHKLNHCGSARADLYRQGLGEFFLDDPYEYRAAVVPLAPAVQAALAPVLADDARLAQLHTPAYSMVAYPWAQRYQQSNQWAIETLAMAREPAAGTRERAQAWLRLQGYEPTTLRLGPLTRLGARATAANVAFDDHPDERRFSDRIDTVTVDSVFAWLQRSGLGGPERTVR
ncbi:DUF2145 domain-containing protein [Piscinibacter sakaiensis]|uniref:Putative outer membrane protein n=1 Tax=Piscinibacter sakaiensis TaxID=1547922 RepID=A0A0K8P1C7_PISS1|nr:putative outer membrane protein [Piscinibacter sakaiensis]